MGLRLSEAKVEKAFVKVTDQELALADGRGSQELPHLMEKRATSKTTPSATKPVPKKLETINIKKLLEAGKVRDKGYSKAGRNLTKKSYKEPSAYPKPYGSISEINNQGQTILEEILNHPKKVITHKSHKRFGEIIEIKTPNNHGVCFSKENEFICFIEP